MHSKKILHRDVKGANILISNQGDVKLADFGLARSTVNMRELTKKVVTLWYRAPELLLGERKYDDRIDVWSAGCLFAELLMNRPLFPGASEPAQMDLIFALCGTPTEATWPGVTKLMGSYRPQQYSRDIKHFFSR